MPHTMRNTLALGVLAGCLALAPASVLAATVPGTAAAVSAVDDFGATIWAWVKGTPGKLGAVALMAGGASKLGGRNAEGGKAAMGLGGGAALAFLPGVADGLFTSAASATSLSHGLSAGWQFVVGLTGGRLLDDHLFLAILGSTLYGLAVSRPSQDAAAVR